MLDWTRANRCGWLDFPNSGVEMMNRTLYAALILSWSAIVNSAAGGDLTGTWGLTTTIKSEPASGILLLRMDSEGPLLTGFYRTAWMGPDTRIANARYNDLDGTVTFSVTRMVAGERVTAHYRGKFQGNTITGKLSVERGGQSEFHVWEAKRL
jgi:hypothetical protein